MHSHLSKFRGVCFQEYRVSFTFTAFLKENFAAAIDRVLLVFSGSVENTYKMRGRHGRTKKSSRPLL